MTYFRLREVDIIILGLEFFREKNKFLLADISLQPFQNRNLYSKMRGKSPINIMIFLFIKLINLFEFYRFLLIIFISIFYTRIAPPNLNQIMTQPVTKLN